MPSGIMRHAGAHHVGLRALWTASAKRSGDGVFGGHDTRICLARFPKSGVALRLPPQSMTLWVIVPPTIPFTHYKRRRT